MSHQITHRNQVGSRAKADFATCLATKDLQRLTLNGHHVISGRVISSVDCGMPCNLDGNASSRQIARVSELTFNVRWRSDRSVVFA